MVNTRPRVYTEHISIPLTAEQREALRRHCVKTGVPIAEWLRESALRAIGRADLSLADSTLNYTGNLARRARGTPKARSDARAMVNLTTTQKTFLERAALAQGVTLSHLVREAALAEAGFKPFAKPSNIGRPLGH